jgi:hypothetical protein
VNGANNRIFLVRCDYFGAGWRANLQVGTLS